MKLPKSIWKGMVCAAALSTLSPVSIGATPTGSQLAQLTEYYLYLFEKQPQLKTIAAQPDFDQRARTTVDAVLDLNKLGVPVRIALNSEDEFFILMPPHNYRAVFFGKDSKEIVHDGAADIVAGKLSTEDALIMLEAYRRMVAEFSSRMVLNAYNQYQLVNGGEAKAMRRLSTACNLAWFAYALTLPEHTVSQCPTNSSNVFASTIARLAPEYEATTFQASSAAATVLTNFTSYLQNYSYRSDEMLLGIHLPGNEQIKMRSYIATLDAALREQDAAIQSVGGVTAWNDVSALDRTIDKLSSQKMSETSLEKIQADQQQLVALCHERDTRYPKAPALAVCAQQ